MNPPAESVLSNTNAGQPPGRSALPAFSQQGVAVAYPTTDFDGIVKTALAFDNIAHAVVPMHRVIGRNRCSCLNSGCDSLGKHPRVSNFTNPDNRANLLIAIADLVESRRPLNLAVFVGPKFGNVVVLDIDVHSPEKDGLSWLRRHEAVHGALPTSHCVISGGGGLHFYFRVPAGVTPLKSGDLGPGAEMQTNHLLILPPSVHPSGRQYTWKSGGIPDLTAIPELPISLRATVVPKRVKPKTSSLPVIRDVDGGERDLNRIIKYCPQMFNLVSTRASHGRDAWIAMLSVVSRCSNGEELAHQLSADWESDGKFYSQEETARQLESIGNATGPWRCETFREKFGATLCDTCIYQNKRIGSPLTLGQERKP